jgi:cyclophilin family peptidyl-prolyl cis-trans isomerase
MKRFPLALLALLLVVASPATARAACDTTVLPDGTRVAELVTALGSICFQLLDAEAPAHTENFLYYVENGLIADSFFHRSVANFVLQGASFRIGQGQLPEEVPKRGVVVPNEPCTRDIQAPPPNQATMICSQRGNERGTVALAKSGGDVNSGSNSWFINLSDNRVNLDNQNGGFTVFARVFQGMNVVEAIAALTRITRDDLAWIGSEYAGQLLPALGQPDTSFLFNGPLLSPPLYDVAGLYGCWDPRHQVSILDASVLPDRLVVVDDPIIPAIAANRRFPWTLSSTCGTPTTLATFVADPGPPECPAVDRIGIATNGPVFRVCTGGACTSFSEFSCAQAAGALAQRELWRADFHAHFLEQLVYVTSTNVTTVPEPGALAAAAIALGSLALLRRSRS